MKNLVLGLCFYSLFNISFSAAQIPQNGLKAHFQFDSNTQDATGNNPNATLATSQVSYHNAGISGQALKLDTTTTGSSPFNSTNPAVDFALGGLNNLNSIIDANNDFTISFWFKGNSSMVTSLIGKREFCSTSPPFLDIRSASVSSSISRLAFEIRNGSALNSNSGLGNNEYTSDCWVHLVASREALSGGGCVVKVYLNGSLSNVETYSQVIQISPTTSSNRVTLAGSPCIGVDGTIPLNGYFDEFMVYDRAISDTEASDIYTHFFNQPHISLSPQGCILVPIEKVNPIEDSHFKVYPNPSRGSITAEFDSKTNQKEVFITLYNLQGQIISRSEFPTGELKRSILLEKLPKGMYQVVLSDKTGVLAAQKVIIQ